MPEPVPAPPRSRWFNKVLAVIFIIFCMELGMFLLIFPWSDLWDRNFFSSLSPVWRHYWDNAYWRGMISGLGRGERIHFAGGDFPAASLRAAITAAPTVVATLNTQ